MAEILTLTVEDKTISVVEVTDEVKGLVQELKKLNEDLKRVEELNREFIHESNSKLTEKILMEIFYKKSKIVDSLELTEYY